MSFFKHKSKLEPANCNLRKLQVFLNFSGCVCLVCGCVFLLLLLIACQPESKGATTPTTQNFIFLGHPYDWRSENRIDPRLELLDYSKYAGVWLGGDVCARTSKAPATLTYLDSIFNLKATTTDWAWGNHDLMEGNAELLLVATGKPSYYTRWQNGLQIIVLNTNLFWHHPWPPAQEDCAAKTAQLDWLKSVLDTVQEASHLVVLHHHGLFNEFKTNERGDTLRPDNLTGMPVRPDCRVDGDFTLEIYPYLQRIQAAGTQVITIAGDVGMRSKGYDFTTPDGIHLLGSGINNSLDMNFPPEYVTNFNPDTVLIVHHDPEGAEVTWDFRRVRDVVGEELPREQWDRLSERLQEILEEE